MKSFDPNKDEWIYYYISLYGLFRDGKYSKWLYLYGFYLLRSIIVSLCMAYEGIDGRIQAAVIGGLSVFIILKIALSRLYKNTYMPLFLILSEAAIITNAVGIFLLGIMNN